MTGDGFMVIADLRGNVDDLQALLDLIAEETDETVRPEGFEPTAP